VRVVYTRFVLVMEAITRFAFGVCERAGEGGRAGGGGGGGGEREVHMHIGKLCDDVELTRMFRSFSCFMTHEKVTLVSKVTF